MARQLRKSDYRFFTGPITPGRTEITGDQGHHLLRVLRLKPDQQVLLVDGRGGVGKGRIVELTHVGAVLEVETVEQHPSRTQARINLVVSISRGERFEWMLEKCTELGVDAIFPTRFERTVKLAGGDKTQQRWERICVGALKQSRRLFLPEISEPMAFNRVLEQLPLSIPGGRLLAGMLEGGDINEQLSVWQREDIVVIVGPEGDFTNQERKWLAAAGAVPVSVNEHTLRVETAAVAFAAILAQQRPGA